MRVHRSGLVCRDASDICPYGRVPELLVELRFESGVILTGAYAARFSERLKGLMGSCPDLPGRNALFLDPCGSIHTFGMAYALDVVLLDGEGIVVASRRDVGPGKIVGHIGAVCAFERESGPGAWPAIGDSAAIRAYPRLEAVDGEGSPRRFIGFAGLAHMRT